jgi:plastocyanin
MATIGAVVLLTVACADEQPDPAPAEAASDEAAVDVRGSRFDPGEVTVTAGGTVTFTNEDSIPHTVTAGTPDAPGDAFDASIGGGETVTLTFDAPGEVDYFCRIHRAMTGTVVVTG